MSKPTDLVVEKIYEGIGSSPYTGFEDIRNLDIVSNPGAVCLNFATSAMNQPPTVSALAYTVDTSTDTFTVSSTSGWYNGMAIKLDTVVTSTGITASRTYWIGNLTSTTFKLYKSPDTDPLNVIDVTGSNGSGTLSTYTLSAPLDKVIDGNLSFSTVSTYIFFLDDSGKVWWIRNYDGATGAATLTTNLVFMGNTTTSSSNANRALQYYKGYLLVFRSGNIDYLQVSKINDLSDVYSSWSYGWKTPTYVSGITRRATIVGQDDVLYFQNGQDNLGSLTQNSGSTFDPTTAGTYTYTASALDLPAGYDVTSLGELGTTLLIGTSQNRVFPWDRVSSSFNLPIELPERKTERILTANNLAYLFSGNTGRIYVTNGTTVQLYKKLPAHIFGTHAPYVTWSDVLAWRNQIYFSFTATDNAGSTLTATGGVWAIDISSSALRCVHQLSYGSYAGSATVIMPNVLQTSPPGDALYMGWSANSTYGMDISATTYHTSYAGYAIGPVYQVGTANNKATLVHGEIVLEKPLASGEGIKLSYRKDRSTSFTGSVTIDYATYGAIQFIQVTFPVSDAVTFQPKMEMTGSTTTPMLKDWRFR